MASQFDFSNAQLPALLPLENSFTRDDSERELKELFLEIFNSLIAPSLFDINVSGARHLGSIDLVRRAVNYDGLALLDESDEYAIRYLYRAWMANNTNGRGMHFLRQFLDILYPGLCGVHQLWQNKSSTYPNGLVSAADGIDIDPDEYYLTSRIQIDLDLSLETYSLKRLTNVIKSSLPARLVPHYRFAIIVNVDYDLSDDVVTFALYMLKETSVRENFGAALVVTDSESKLWYLGLESDPDNAVHLKNYDTVTLNVSGTLSYSTAAVTAPYIGEDGLYVDTYNGYQWYIYEYSPFSAELYIDGEAVS